jgi:hypothetical protein
VTPGPAALYLDGDRRVVYEAARMSPLRLTDSEMDIVMAAARPLAVADRDGFLQAVAERLATIPERGDGIVYQIVRDVQRRHWDPPIHDVVGPTARYAKASGAR